MIFPHQLFDPHPLLSLGIPIFIVEEYLFFRQYRFHKKKLIFHRASMKGFANRILSKKVEYHYIAATDPRSDIRLLIPALAREGFKKIIYIDTTDNWLEKRMQKSIHETGLRSEKLSSPLFLNQLEEVTPFFETRKTYFQTDFYTWQRKKRNILLTPEGKPVGGKWTYDAENREKFPRKGLPPLVDLPKPNEEVNEAVEYVEQYFPGNPGTSKGFFFPVDHSSALTWFSDFLVHRFAAFGRYEDAMVMNEPILHHSLISPLLNAGLLSPQQVIEETLAESDALAIPLASLEGFLRQVMGWREFIRIVYEREGSRQRTHNYWNHTRKIPSAFYTGETGVLPVDTVIRRVLETGYCHHIERLMVLGNFMLLCEFDPDEVYRWFMELFIDSYDWVMVPNVYGMTQFADGGLMTTKPYISGSNYLLKMGDWQKGPWQETWDGLFWRFMHVHRDFFTQNPRLGMLVKTFDKMPVEKRKQHLKKADEFLSKL
ncbi:MAG: cryptochrome/photolyase family protein [Chitinophagaceae bacterium]|nr:cryptochrome/photolyase family protein [Chitinophagaceae bacterium]